MDNFCKECGKPISDSLSFCQHCGAKIGITKRQSGNNTTTPSPKKSKSYTKKQKIIMSAVALFLIILAGFYMWGKSHYSAENTANRFITALIEKDEQAVKSLTILNGKSITDAEAKALITLAKDEAYAINLQSTNLEDFQNSNDLFNITENGKSLFIFPQHVFSLVPQYASLDLPFQDIKTTFNEAEFSVLESHENGIVYGPMAPGKYSIHNSYSGEFTEAESDDTLVLANAYEEHVYHDIELDAEFVTLDLYNRNGSPIKSASIEVNDQTVPFNDDLRIENFGPLNLDGSVTVTPIIETEWGEVKLESIEVEEDYYEIVLSTLNNELMDELSDIILLYGEEYVQAHAANDSELFTTNTPDLKSRFKDNFEYNASSEMFFTGQLDKIEIDYDSLVFYESNEVSLPASFYFTAATYYDTADAELEERIDDVILVMTFDPDEKKWLIDSANTRYSYNDFNTTKTLEGSQELHQSSLTTIAPASISESTDLDAQIEETTLNYIYELVEAINTDNYELVRPYIKDDSALHAMQMDLIDRLVDNGMTQEVINATVTSIKEKDGKWDVVTDETIKKIYASGEEETNDYVWNYTVEEDGDGVALTNIE